jgi:hypothetical protein
MIWNLSGLKENVPALANPNVMLEGMKELRIASFTIPGNHKS